MTFQQFSIYSAAGSDILNNKHVPRRQDPVLLHFRTDRGVLIVEVKSFSAPRTNQAQPLPKRLTAAVLNSSELESVP
jgi:hypothetical protein